MVSYSVKLICNKSRIQLDGTASLYLVVIINRVVKHLPLNLKWPASLVDNKKGIIEPRKRNDPDYNDYQLIIDTELSKVNEIFKIYRIQDRVLTMELFLEDLQNIECRRDFIPYMEKKIMERYKYKEIGFKTKTAHIGTLRRLKKFRTIIPLYITDRKFLQQFKARLIQIYKNDAGTVWGRIKDVKTYLHLAIADGMTVNPDFENFVNTPPLPSITYLEEEEINKLLSLYNSGRLDEQRQNVLRAFLFSCFTSLRISDVQLAEWGWVTLNNELQFIPYKNRRFKREVTIPLSAIAKKFIERKIGKFFSLPTDQEMNRSLKDIAALDCVNIKKNLTFHVSRHTFGTHYYKQTKDVVTLQKIMGHSKITTTMIYVHVNEQDKRTGIDIMNDSFLKNSGFLRLVR
ncbi:site-specific integrase [Pedobacter ginsengisoli]|uniref:site-specific integrase n=1 Tax=Pedobacter ginsengisoli TaxID=363852 RepID=UPI00254B25D0|nr:site-specific integrase [Pedobacter ginsengisoli]